MCLVEINTIWRGDSAALDEIDEEDDIDEDFSKSVHDNKDEEKMVMMTLLPPLDSMNGLYFNLFNK